MKKDDFLFTQIRELTIQNVIQVLKEIRKTAKGPNGFTNKSDRQFIMQAAQIVFSGMRQRRGVKQVGTDEVNLLGDPEKISELMGMDDSELEAAMKNGQE